MKKIESSLLRFIKNKKVLIALGSTILICGILLYFASRSDSTFDSKKWKEAGLYPKTRIRQQMYQDLISRHRLYGMTEEQVIQLLGPPSRRADWGLIYYMGPEPGAFAIDAVWIQIKITNNKVAKIDWING